jgi:histone deacetylase 1/2
VDDIILIASTTSLLRHVVQQLYREFTIKDLGDLHFFLSVQVRRDASGFSLSQA